MEYKASDIIRRATQLADLENSDFISYNENIFLLNEAYNKFYQKMLNHNDKSFLHTVTLEGSAQGYVTTYTLPDDFWQIYGLRTAVNNRPIQRKAQSESDTTLSYDIINDELVVYGSAETHKLILDYWEKAPFLTFPNKTKELDQSYSWKQIYKNRALGYDTNNDLQYLNADGDVLAQVTIHSAVQTVTAGANAVATLETDGTAYISRWRNNALSEASIAQCNNVFVHDGIVYAVKLTGFSIELYNQNSKKVADIAWDDVSVFKKIIAMDDRFILYTDTNDVLHAASLNAAGYWETKQFDLTVYGYDTGALWEDGSVYLLDDDGNVLNVLPALGTAAPITDAMDAMSVCYTDRYEGYGYIDADNNMRSFFPDTLLNFPDTFYFTILSYFLAIAYKAKQNAEASQLAALAEQAEEQFYDTIGRDSFQVTRIRNHY